MMRRIMSKEEQLRLAAIINADRHQKLHELGHMIRGTHPGIGPRQGQGSETKGASSRRIFDAINNNLNDNPRYQRHYRVLSDKQRKLKELGKMIRGT